MITIEDIRAFMELSLGKECEGGTVRAFYDPPEGASGIGFRFGTRCPTSKAKAEALAQSIHAGIKLNWQASDRKHARVYTLQIRDRAQNIEAERQFAIAPEPVRIEDLQNKALETGMLALQSAQDRLAQPFDQLKDLLEIQAATIRADQTEKAELRARVLQLENERVGAVDKFLSLHQQASESMINAAQADAIRAEGEAKAQAWKDMAKTAMANAPAALGIAAKLIGMKSAPGLEGRRPGAPATQSAGSRFTPPPKPMSAEAAAMVRAMGAKLNDAELSALLKFAYDTDPSGRILMQILTQESAERVVSIVVKLGEEWGI